MSEIEKMTQHIKYRPYIDKMFKSIGITNLKISTRLPERLLYSRLDVFKVFLMSDEDQTFIEVMKAISKLLDLEVEEINAEEARSFDVGTIKERYLAKMFTNCVIVCCIIIMHIAT